MIGLAAIEDARNHIARYILSTPLVRSPPRSNICGFSVGLKLEHSQITGSFKLRGATNAITKLTKAERDRGVVATSTGNHGRALAHAAHAVGSRATICMSRLVPENKVSEVQRLGAGVRVVGSPQDEAQNEAERLVEVDGLVMLPPFNHPEVVAGQRTIGLKIVEAMPDVATVLAPLSGGGLAAGVAAAIKSIRCHAKVVGLTMARRAAMKASLDAGRPVQVEEVPSLADSLGGDIGLDNRVTFAMCRALLDDVVLLTEDEIAAAIRHAYDHELEVLEDAGAVGVAALLANKISGMRGPAVLVLSGRTAAAGAVVAKYLARKDVSVAALLGAGSQAKLQLKALTLVRAIREAPIWARSASKAKTAAQELSALLKFPLVPYENPFQAVNGSHIIVTTTSSDKPILKSSWLEAGRHVTAMGSDAEHQNEIEPAAISRAMSLTASSKRDGLGSCIMQ